MLEEVLRELDPHPGDVVCDCTLGGAGHSKALARRIAPDGLSVGIDQDVAALAAATRAFATELPGSEHVFWQGNFARLDDALLAAEVPGVDAFLFDLGVSSPQLDIPARGFSYHHEAPLDMRMSPGNQTLTAAEVIHTYNEADLARILRSYGDERHAQAIARSIVRRRAHAPIRTTTELAELVRSAIPASSRRRGGHPARRTFQALRIEVNGELSALDEGLRAAVRWLNPGGRVCVIAYHSLEDRVVSHVLFELSRGCTCPPDLPVCACGNVPILRLRTRRPLTPTPGEVERNPRARSARMRVAERLPEEGISGREAVMRA